MVKLEEQGRIHGYPSRVRVGWGSDEINQLGSWAGAVTPKPPKTLKKQSVTNRPTDRPTDRVGCRVAGTRLKIDPTNPSNISHEAGGSY